MKSVNNYREQLSRIKKLKNDNSLNIDLLQYGITEQYYNDIVKAVGLLIEFEQKYLHSHKYYNSIAKTIEDIEDEDMKLCILVDVMRCYDGLNHPTSYTTPEGVALLLLICRIYKIGGIEKYEDLENVNYSAISTIDLTPALLECSYEFGNHYSLFLSKLLEENTQIDTLYRMLIYNLCKRIAEVDGEISIPEKEWLEEIARLDDEDVSNDIDISVFD